jgi:hypothetical protein
MVMKDLDILNVRVCKDGYVGSGYSECEGM